MYVEHLSQRKAGRGEEDGRRSEGRVEGRERRKKWRESKMYVRKESDSEAKRRDSLREKAEER